MVGLGLALPPVLAGRLEHALKTLDDRDWTVAFAESCTGGLAGAAVSGVENLGHVLECVFVTYSDDAKTRLLGVPADLIEAEGAVSDAVARTMAKAALERSEADLAISVTGFAGPAGDDDEEGRVHFAAVSRDGWLVTRESHFGPVGRDRVRLACLEVIVDLLEEAGAAP